MSCARPRPDEHPVEVAEISGPEFPIKVSAFAELDGGFVPGRYYRFESLPHGILSPIQDRAGELPELVTSDFGRH